MGVVNPQKAFGSPNCLKPQGLTQSYFNPYIIRPQGPVWRIEGKNKKIKREIAHKNIGIQPKSSKESTIFKFSKCPFHLGLSSDFNTIAQTWQDAQHEYQNCFQAQNQHTKGRQKSVFSISGLAQSRSDLLYNQKNVCVCVFWPPGELEKADDKAAIGPWQRCYQPDERLPRPSFDQQITERGLGFSVNRPSRLN